MHSNALSRAYKRNNFCQTGVRNTGSQTECFHVGGKELEPMPLQPAEANADHASLSYVRKRSTTQDAVIVASLLGYRRDSGYCAEKAQPIGETTGGRPLLHRRRSHRLIVFMRCMVDGHWLGRVRRKSIVILGEARRCPRSMAVKAAFGRSSPSTLPSLSRLNHFPSTDPLVSESRSLAHVSTD